MKEQADLDNLMFEEFFMQLMLACIPSNEEVVPEVGGMSQND